MNLVFFKFLELIFVKIFMKSDTIGYYIVGRVRDWSSSHLVGVRHDRRWMAFSWIIGKSSGFHRFLFPSIHWYIQPGSRFRFQTSPFFLFILFYHLSQSRGIIISPALPLLSKNDLLLSIAQLWPRFFFLIFLIPACVFLILVVAWALLASGDI